MKKLVILVVMMFFSTSYAGGTVMGAGATTCGKHTSGSEYTQNVNLQWSLGFLSAMNISEPKNADFFASTDIPAIRAALLLYCQNNPLENVFGASLSIFGQLVNRARK